MCAQLGKDTDDPYPTLQPKDEEGIVIAEFNLDEIAEARHRYVLHGMRIQWKHAWLMTCYQDAHVASM